MPRTTTMAVAAALLFVIASAPTVAASTPADPGGSAVAADPPDPPDPPDAPDSPDAPDPPDSPDPPDCPDHGSGHHPPGTCDTECDGQPSIDCPCR